MREGATPGHWRLAHSVPAWIALFPANQQPWCQVFILISLPRTQNPTHPNLTHSLTHKRPVYPSPRRRSSSLSPPSSSSLPSPPPTLLFWSHLAFARQNNTKARLSHTFLWIITFTHFATPSRPSFIDLVVVDCLSV